MDRGELAENELISSIYLAPGPDAFSALRFLSIPASAPCILFITRRIDFEHLTTLIITRPFGQALPGLYTICSLLQHTPQLETLWYKTPDIDAVESVPSQSLLTSIFNFLAPIPIPLLLSRLSTASVTVPGTGANVLICINAPALRSLHLDGSRATHSSHLHPDIAHTLQRVAIRSPQLAITEANISEQTWRWIFCGSPLSENELIRDHHSNGHIFGVDTRIPFPYLEKLAVHSYPFVPCGLNDAILLSYAAQPGLKALRRLVLRQSMGVSGDVLVSMLQSIRNGRRL